MISCAIWALDLIDGVLWALNSIFCCSSPAWCCLTPDLNRAIYGKSFGTYFYAPSTDAPFIDCICFAFLLGGLYSSYRYDITLGTATDDIGGIITIVDLEGLTVYCWFGVIIYWNEVWLCWAVPCYSWVMSAVFFWFWLPFLELAAFRGCWGLVFTDGLLKIFMMFFFLVAGDMMVKGDTFCISLVDSSLTPSDCNRFYFMATPGSEHSSPFMLLYFCSLLVVCLIFGTFEWFTLLCGLFYSFFYPLLRFMLYIRIMLSFFEEYNLKRRF